MVVVMSEVVLVWGFLLQQAARSKRQTDSVEKLCRVSLALLSRGSYSTTARLDPSVTRN
jgi:hypothetical protein